MTTKKRRFTRALLLRTAWVLNALICLWIIFQVREAYLLTAASLDAGPLLMNFVDNVIVIILAVVAMGVLVLVEQHYKNNLPKTFFQVTGIQLVILGVIDTIQGSVYNLDGIFPARAYHLQIVVLLGVGLLMYFYGRRTQWEA